MFVKFELPKILENWIKENYHEFNGVLGEKEFVLLRIDTDIKERMFVALLAMLERQYCEDEKIKKHLG